MELVLDDAWTGCFRIAQDLGDFADDGDRQSGTEENRASKSIRDGRRVD